MPLAARNRLFPSSPRQLAKWRLREGSGRIKETYNSLNVVDKALKEFVSANPGLSLLKGH